MIHRDMPTYEQVLLAIAVKNKMVSQEDASACLRDFSAEPEASRTPIEEMALSRGILKNDQISILVPAARKVAGLPPEPALTLAPKPDPKEPIPGIRMKGKLGVGGTATVFVADDVHNDREVAVKIILPKLAQDEKALARFRREAELLVDFDHPNIVKGYENGMMGPLAYLVMEKLDGESGQEALERDGAFSEAKSLEVILETAKAIDYMQSKGILHRDIKPDNIMLLTDGSVKVLDLGFAMDIAADGSAQEDEETTSGTVQYMSPEQARGQGLDVRADIYSLGATLYHMIMGELPFTGKDSMEVMAKQVMEALSSTAIKNRRISKHMHYFIERMMSKDKDLRYATPKEMVEDITEQIEGFRSLEYHPEDEQAAPPPPSPPPPKKPATSRFARPPKPATSRFARPAAAKKSSGRFVKPPGGAKPPTSRFSKLEELKNRLNNRKK